MAFYRMPSLGADMEKGQLIEWLVEPGQEVEAGTVVAVVETQKGAIEIEVFERTRFVELVAQPGATVPVGEPLAKIVTAERGVAAEVEEPLPLHPPPEAGIAVAPAAAVPTGPMAAPGAAVQPTRPLASPAARKLAAERRIDLGALRGSGVGGAIQSADVLAVAAPSPAIARRGLDLAEMRKAIAAAMARSKREIPHYYLAHSFSTKAVQDWLTQQNAARPPEARLLLAVPFVKALALSLAAFPEFNGRFEGGSFRPSEAIHVGLAVSIRGGGLIAPAIRHTDRLTVDKLMTRMRDLVARSRTGQLRASELSDATITLSSLGERGVERLYGVIYPPQVALVGLGRIEQRPWPVDDGVGIRPVATLTLSADHRANDGHRGALLLREIDPLLQEPDKL